MKSGKVSCCCFDPWKSLLILLQKSLLDYKDSDPWFFFLACIVPTDSCWTWSGIFEASSSQSWWRSFTHEECSWMGRWYMVWWTRLQDLTQGYSSWPTLAGSLRSCRVQSYGSSFTFPFVELIVHYCFCCKIKSQDETVRRNKDWWRLKPVIKIRKAFWWNLLFLKNHDQYKCYFVLEWNTMFNRRDRSPYRHRFQRQIPPSFLPSWLQRVRRRLNR